MDGGRTIRGGEGEPRPSRRRFARIVAMVVTGVLLLTVLNPMSHPDVLVRPTPGEDAVALPLYDLLNRTGISQDGASDEGDLDGAGNSLSARTLAAAGWSPGGEVDILDTSMRLPVYGEGRPDHVLSDGQSLTLGEPTRLRSLTFLATGTRTDGTGADVRSVGSVVYSDGGEHKFELVVPDWAAGPAGDAALTLPYANSATGFGLDVIGSVRLYARSVPLEPGREVDHVVLPEVTDPDANLHVFSVGGRQADREWTGTWARATSGYTEVGPWQDQTLRLAVRSTTGGHKVRVRLDNTFASRPVTIGAVSLALRDTGARTRGAAIPLTFSGARGAVIPAGGRLVSDPIDFLLPPSTELLVSIHLPDRVTAAPIHYASVDTNFTTAPGSGDRTLEREEEPFTGTVEQWPFLTGIEVMDGPGAVVTFGDSITDGVRSTRDAYARWPDVLSDRLRQRSDLPDPGVLNLGVAGNRVTTDGYPGEGVSTYANGVSLLHRAQRDVFSQNGVESVVVFAGINDLRWGASAEEVIAGLNRLARMARDHDVRIFVATLGPCEGGSRCTPGLERQRQRINAHLREQRLDPESPFTGVWDFDAVLRDPERPTRLRPEYDSGDHLHPGDAGLRAIAESVDLYELLGS
ncbi:GDSL-like Lipase/Acylhydrolase family protein [Nocardiopsis alba ATCC BAA-2165]|uniref:GDSL-like Lipase/Acylhydrolase family protein n=2 Tax=Nocardiopsis alba TaxID=53437 RepID=J7L6H0_NOCAA|nr:GDSL-like Lipase/Acylhydrolase family protein [Nocardiopsis alba ATCC BAA-2165]